VFEAVKQWVYRPTVVNGVPMEAITEVAVLSLFARSSVIAKPDCHRRIA
jgi:hypothetical protein